MESRALDIPGVFRLGETRRKPDQSFPLNLGREGVHEICEARHGDMAAMTGFALAAARPPAGAAPNVRGQRSPQTGGCQLGTGLARLS